MMRKDDYCVLLVSDDKYQLPLASADSVSELASRTGLSRRSLQDALHNGTSVRLPKSRYHSRKGLVIRVTFEEEENNGVNDAKP